MVGEDAATETPTTFRPKAKSSPTRSGWGSVRCPSPASSGSSVSPQLEDDRDSSPLIGGEGNRDSAVLGPPIFRVVSRGSSAAA